MLPGPDSSSLGLYLATMSPASHSRIALALAFVLEMAEETIYTWLFIAACVMLILNELYYSVYLVWIPQGKP
jgi:hypothetical protein